MQNIFTRYTSLFLKGFAMGAANVIPGVSGGTVALITGIFEKLIHSIKSFDHIALFDIFKGNFRSFANRVNLGFLIAVFGGAVVSIFTLARVLEYLFANYPVYIWAWFFGLIAASVYFVGKTISRWLPGVVLAFVAGTGLAVWISFMSPAQSNDSFLYLILCGVVAVSSMILPGLSGSFILILMGNYELIAIDAVNDFRIEILFPVAIGIAGGLLMFSHFLSYIFKRFRDITLGTLTGFIAGSLIILWPWKYPVFKTDTAGEYILKTDGSLIIENYIRFIPDSMNLEVFTTLLIMVIGVYTIVVMEKVAGAKR